MRSVILGSLGEVTAVVEGERPGTVIVENRGRNGGTSYWVVNDTGNALVRTFESPAAAPSVAHCADTTCYRVARTALRVEASDDGGSTYATSWELGGRAYEKLAESYPNVGNPADHLSSRAVVVHAVQGGHVVFVANGRDGLLYRDVHGAWARLGFPTSGEGCCFYEPPMRTDSKPRSIAVLAIVVAVAVAATLAPPAILAIMRRRTWRWTDIAGLLALAAMAGYGASIAVRFPNVGMFPGIFYGIPLLLAILACGPPIASLFGSDKHPTRP
ncbi:hypothetical protein SAMN05421684_0574 [Asanoa ishikariensis]|uniref:Uncharacterized protein n=1 Tax=Asanoa ishikariensis TaxID=137265 RepID=A0A1H3L739_9ACTN|nr:hypothetical protein [Asanoa ishikariensis]SDY60106.1 hypothetical protein SAMN05421684_0574 [Asanoa ishikariensis]